MADDPFRPLRVGRLAAPAKASAAEWTVLTPVPKNAPAAPVAHFKRGKPSAAYPYRDPRGGLLGYVCRFDLAGGGKELLPLTYCRSAKGELAWRWQSWAEPRPLYNLDELAMKPMAPVIVCEGEKAADAAAELCPDHVVVTSPHGSQSAAKADWSVLHRRDVTIWRDNDESGVKYAEAVARTLLPIASSVKLLTPPKGAKAGWDAADALAAGWDQTRASALLVTAVRWVELRRRRTAAAGSGDDDADGGYGTGDTAIAARGRRRRRADELLDLIADIELWHSPEGDAYATAPVNSHFENWPVPGKGFRRWIAGQYFRRTSRGASRQAIDEALCTIEAIAINNGAEHTPCLRVGEHAGDIYVDLADADWRVVRVSGTEEWKIVDRAPVRFLRPPDMAPLPEPEAGDDTIIQLLQKLFPHVDEDQLMLAAAWQVDAFRPTGPYSVLAIYGTGGDGKTSFARFLRSAIDPCRVPDIGPPRDEAALCLAAKNSRVVAFDNLSRIPEWLSDTMCRISTGAGIRSRVLYTNDEEVTYFLKRPQSITAIKEAVVRGDLLSRTNILTLPEMPKCARRTEEDFAAEADKLRPRVFGALLSGVASALKRRDEIPPVELPRMADFATWVWRACPGLGWEREAFLAAYAKNKAIGADIAFEADGLAATVVALMALRKPDDDGVTRWEGISTRFARRIAGR